MNSSRIYEKTLPSGRTWWLHAALMAGIFLTLLLGALAIPFFYETQTLWYKFGVNKVLLQAGQIIGLLAAVLLFTQVLLTARISFIEKTFALDNLLHVHRFNGLTLLFLVIFHVLLILVPEGISNLPIGWKFWPELVGATTLSLLIPLVLVSEFRKHLKMPYGLWRRFHRPIGFLIFLLTGVHIFYVSDSFDRTLPKIALLTIMSLIILVIITSKVIMSLRNRLPWTVEKVEQLDNSITSLILTPSQTADFNYAPGQFSLLSFPKSSRLLNGSEPHPFTIASSPHQPKIRFLIKASGDWTGSLHSIKKDDIAHIEGPYGRFSYRKLPTKQTLLMIAGGIGITPMFSMLHHMTSNKSEEEITLIWSIRSDNEEIFMKELQEIQHDLPQLTTHIICTSGQGSPGKRISKELIQKLLPTEIPQVFLCGPPKMMSDIKTYLLQEGVPKSNIHWEKFSF